MSSRDSSGKGGLTVLDGAKIIGAIVLVVALIIVVMKVVGAIVHIISLALIAAAVLAAVWVVWNLVRGDPD